MNNIGEIHYFVYKGFISPVVNGILPRDVAGNFPNVSEAISVRVVY